MASSSRGREGADEVANDIPEDLVLSWTRDASTMNTFGTFVENDRKLLEELIQCVHKEKDWKATKQKLSALFGTDKDRKSVVIRARVLSRLIAIAFGLHPDDITMDSETEKESLRRSVDFQTALYQRLVEGLQERNSVLSYLLKDALEADDEVMTVIFCDPRFFKKYSVPYFHGCNLDLVQKISKLWLSQGFLRGFYYHAVLEPLRNQVTEELLKGTVRRRRGQISEESLFTATMMLGELLRRRTAKAGARLLEVMLSYWNGREYRVRDVVKGLVIPLLTSKKSEFRKWFIGNFQNRAREVRWHSQVSEQLPGHHGQSIIIGPSIVQTDSNLLCWAARRGYSELIRCISAEYSEYREGWETSPIEYLLDDATEALGISLLWKVALWCATRHGQDSVIMELMRPQWVKSIDFNDYIDIERCLPPLHLVSLFGDRILMRMLCMGQVGIHCGAYKTDYLGKTPLDYAMQFQLTTKNSKEGVKITNDIRDRMQFQVTSNAFRPLRPIARNPTTRMLDFSPSRILDYSPRRMPDVPPAPAPAPAPVPPIVVVDNSPRKMPDSPPTRIVDNSPKRMPDSPPTWVVDNSPKSMPDYPSTRVPDDSLQSMPDYPSTRVPDDSFRTMPYFPPTKVQDYPPTRQFDYLTTGPTNYYSTTGPQETSYDIRRLQHPTVKSGGMLTPTPGHQSCIRQLLQMPGVVDRLKELNDMYTTQANFVLVGAALIASVAFGGWLQPPLGYTDYFQFTSPSPPAPVGTYEQYVAVEGHLSVHMFVAFNALSFFLGIGTMLIGAEATLFLHDNDERTIALMKVRKSIKWMLGFFITSMVCIMAAFICAGLAILPPIQKLEWSMIVSLCLGACICSIPLTWILFSLAKDQIVELKDQMVKLIMPFNKEKKFDHYPKDGSLVDGKDMKTLQDEKEKKCCEQPCVEPNSLNISGPFEYRPPPREEFEYRPPPREEFEHRPLPREEFGHRPSPREEFEHRSPPREEFEHRPPPRETLQLIHPELVHPEVDY